MRAALLRLEHDGLVVRERNRGARVRRFTPEEAVEILEARAALESLAAGYAARAAHRRRGRASCAGARGGDGAAARDGRAAGDVRAQRRSCTAASSRSPATGSRSTSAARLHSQVVRYQFRTVLAAGRPQKSLAEHERDRRRRSPPGTARPRSWPCASTSATWRRCWSTSPPPPSSSARIGARLDRGLPSG